MQPTEVRHKGKWKPKNEQIFGFLWKKPLLCEVELHKIIYYERKTDLQGAQRNQTQYRKI